MIYDKNKGILCWQYNQQYYEIPFFTMAFDDDVFNKGVFYEGVFNDDVLNIGVFYEGVF